MMKVFLMERTDMTQVSTQAVLPGAAPPPLQMDIGAQITITGLNDTQKQMLRREFNFVYTRQIMDRGRLAREQAIYPVLWERYDGMISLPYGCLPRLLQHLSGWQITGQIVQPEIIRSTFISKDDDFPALMTDKTNRRGQDDALLQAIQFTRLSKHYGYTLVAPCGAGKSWLGCILISKYKQPTLILCHTKELLRQWEQLIIKTFGIRPALILNGKGEPGEYITIGLIQTVSRHAARMADSFGMVIVDECHHVPADTFQKAMNVLNSTVKIGLTASDKRSDGLHPLIHAVIGPVVATIDQQDMVDDGTVMQPTIRTIKTDYKWTGKDAAKNHAKMMSNLAENDDRNELIAAELICQVSKGRKILAIGCRLEQMERIAEIIRWFEVPVQILTGSKKDEEQREIMEKMQTGFPITLASEKIAKEGLDAPILDTLVFLTPAKDAVLIQQAVGRVQRSMDGKPDPLVIDFTDYSFNSTKEAREAENSSETLFYWQHQARKKVYKALGAKYEI
jgi:superfamily II DNA or RNA helicase